MKFCPEFPSNRADKFIMFVEGRVWKLYKNVGARELSAVEQVEMLRKIYSLLEEKQVPNVDRLVKSETIPSSLVCLEPIGSPEKPATEKVLLEAVVCILEALEVGLWVLSCGR